jgi:hypothetical protein
MATITAPISRCLDAVYKSVGWNAVLPDTVVGLWCVQHLGYLPSVQYNSGFPSEKNWQCHAEMFVEFRSEDDAVVFKMKWSGRG